MSFRKGFWFHDNGISSIPSFFIVVKGEREKGRIYGKLLVFN